MVKKDNNAIYLTGEDAVGGYAKIFLEYRSNHSLEIGQSIHSFATTLLQESNEEHTANEKSWVVQVINKNKIKLSGYFEEPPFFLERWKTLSLGARRFDYRLSLESYEQPKYLAVLPTVDDSNVHGFTIKYETPTTIHNDRFYPLVVFPDTKIVKINVESKQIIINNYKAHYRMVGTTGMITYEFDKDLASETKRELLNYVLEAEWVGLGAKTTYGLGNITVDLNRRR